MFTARRMTLSEPRRFKVQLVDSEGRTNKLTSEIVVNVTRNHPPVGQDHAAGARCPGVAGRRTQAQGRNRG